MVEAIVGVALRAVLASFVLGGVLALCVLIATRTLALTAAARHALWTTALIAIGVMPLAGIGVSLARGTAAPPARVAHSRPSSTVDSMNGAASRRERSAASLPDGSGSHAQPSGGAASAADRIAALANTATGWKPRMSHTFAVAAVALWAIGALIGIGGLAASIVRVRGLKRRSSPLDGTLPDELPWLTEVGPGREIYLRLSYETETPVAIGFGRPVILIPTELATAGGLSAIEPLILHEHAHLRRFDDWTNLAQRTIERLFWFNPIVWLVGRRIALEREIASDDAVVEKTGEAHRYATSLWKLAREMRMPEHAVVAPGALLTRKQISVRIEQLLDANRAHRRRSPAAALGVTLAAVLAVGLVATSAPAVELPAAPAAVAVMPAGSRAAVASKPALARGVSQRTADSRASHAAFVSPAHRTIVRTYERVVTSKPATTTATSAERSAEPAKVGQSPQVAQPAQAAHAAQVAQAAQAARVAQAAHAMQAAHVAQAARTAADARAVAVVSPGGAKPTVIVKVLVPPGAAASRVPSVPALPPMPAQLPDGRRIATIAGDVAGTMRDAMAAIPAQIAQESPGLHRHAPFAGAQLTRELIASCTACSLAHADLRGLDLHGLRIEADSLSGADMRNVNLAHAQLVGVSLDHANLAGADLRGAQLNGVGLDGANFDGANLDGIKLVGVSLRHVSLRGTALRSMLVNCTGCDMQGIDLRGQDLRNVVLTGTDLSYADLRNANLTGARLTGVDLSHARFEGANLTDASFLGCDFSGTSLRDATTTRMNVRGGQFDG